MSLEKFRPKDEWRKGGVGYILAHPDDEVLAMKSIRKFQNYNIPMIFIYLTAGERGIPREWKDIEPQEMRDTRIRELESGMKALGVEKIVFDYNDAYLYRESEESMTADVLKVVREKQLKALISFNPHDIIYQYDHEDHIKAGNIARRVSTQATTREFHPEIPIPAGYDRPSLYLLTFNKAFATHKLKLKKKDIKDKVDYLSQHHVSQFPSEHKERWGVLFDRIHRGKNGISKRREMYLEVR